MQGVIPSQHEVFELLDGTILQTGHVQALQKDVCRQPFVNDQLTCCLKESVPPKKLDVLELCSVGLQVVVALL